MQSLHFLKISYVCNPIYGARPEQYLAAKVQLIETTKKTMIVIQSI